MVMVIKPFLPSCINYNWGWNDTKLDSLLAEANRQIGELNAYSLLLPNVDLYIKMHVKIEANKSSKIEGTRTTIEEDLSDVLDISPEKKVIGKKFKIMLRQQIMELKELMVVFQFAIDCLEKYTKYYLLMLGEKKRHLVNLDVLKIGSVEPCHQQHRMFLRLLKI